MFRCLHQRASGLVGDGQLAIQYASAQAQLASLKRKLADTTVKLIEARKAMEALREAKRPPWVGELGAQVALQMIRVKQVRADVETEPRSERSVALS